MTEFRAEYENETGKKALYRMDSSDYHTLKYVDWLEAKLKKTEEAVKLLIHIDKDIRPEQRKEWMEMVTQ